MRAIELIDLPYQNNHRMFLQF